VEYRTIPTRTDELLDADTLPLVLLAAVAHPDRRLAARLRRRLDAAIEEGGPLHGTAEVHQFLIGQGGTPGAAFYLEPLAVEVGIRVVRLLFSQRTHKVGRQTLRTVSCEVLDDTGALVFNHRLKPVHFERFYAVKPPRPRWRTRREEDEEEAPRPERRLRKAHRRYQKMLGRSSVFVAGGVRPRLAEFDTGPRLVQAECRTEGGFCLTVCGDLPWPRCDLAGDRDPQLTPRGRRAVHLTDGSSLGGHHGFRSLGLAVEPGPGEVCLRTTTPESVLRFSACLSRGDRLVLQDAGVAPGRVVVLLRDFDGDAARFPVAVSYAGAETWLRGLPALPLSLDDDERLAIARWAYPPEAWLTNEFLEQLS
jgi:hypothetical protein